MLMPSEIEQPGMIDAPHAVGSRVCREYDIEHPYLGLRFGTVTFAGGREGASGIDLEVYDVAWDDGSPGKHYFRHGLTPAMPAPDCVLLHATPEGVLSRYVHSDAYRSVPSTGVFYLPAQAVDAAPPLSPFMLSVLRAHYSATRCMVIRPADAPQNLEAWTNPRHVRDMLDKHYGLPVIAHLSSGFRLTLDDEQPVIVVQFIRHYGRENFKPA